MGYHGCNSLMAIYTAVSDEAAGGNLDGTFVMAGYAASESDWPYFSTAWQERVLDGPPRIPYPHMSEIRRDSWRSQHNIPYNDAEERISEAIRVIYSSGNLVAVGSHMRRDDLGNTVHASVRQEGIRPPYGVAEPDYLCFIAYSYGVLIRLPLNTPTLRKCTLLFLKNER